MIEKGQVVLMLGESGGAFTAAFRGVTGGQFHFKPAPDRWSIAETAEHVTVAETGSGKLIRGKLVRDATAPELLAQTVGAEERVDGRLAKRDQPFPAPDFVLPTGRWTTPDEMMAVFEESRQATIDFIKTTEHDLTTFAVPHPALGPLNGLQWGYFLVRHCVRHIEQIDEVKAAAGYPK